MLDFSFEKKLLEQGYKIIAAIDEAGRGPLAGPVVAACVIFNSDFIGRNLIGLVKDSKKLSAVKRQELMPIIRQEFLAVGIGTTDHQTIDKINILQAAFLAMKKALGQAKIKPDLILVDGGFKIPNCSVRQEAIIRGDEKVFSIAASSILAKVARDNLMLAMDKIYPEYGFSQHKGYGTKLHLERLKKHGPCPIHRLSFAPVKKAVKSVLVKNG